MQKLLPKIFIGSTVEGLELAELMQEQLMYDFEIQIWNQGIFKSGLSNLQNLIESSNKFDYAVFLFTFDDTTIIRDNNYKTVRDNIIFEYGLFTGSLGKNRTWFVIDDDVDMTHLPTDLIGINPIKYKTNKKSIHSIVGPICTQLKRMINELELDNCDDTLKNRRNYQEFMIEKNKMIGDLTKKLKLSNVDFYDCGIIAIDIDGFEKVNRVFGVEAAEKVLSQVGKIVGWFLERILQPSQYHYIHFSGDEFFVLININELDEPESELSLEDFSNAIISEIKGYDWNRFIPNLYLSCSAGYGTPNCNETIEECFTRALYATKIAKKLGGNATCPAPMVHDPRIRSELYFECSLRRSGGYTWKKRNNTDDLDY